MRKIYLLALVLLFITIKGNSMEDANKTVAKNANEVCPIKISEEAPSAVLHTIEGRAINIKDVIKGEKAILIFYRGGWCPYCNLQLSELQKIENELIDLGFKIVAISMDKPEYLSATLGKYKMKYELYSDSKANASKAFGIAFTVENEYIQKLKNFNMDLEASSGETHHILPVPSVFIVDDKGIIQFEYVNPNYKIRINSKLLLEAAKIIQ
ncbi:MAG: antioxidant AhpC [Ignavibacteria bacterium CG22_combo_CG10-13_8_21_14_all_37_15]|nr:AhpC/TSA family protein [Ignavibacteria bacterium]OIO18575.1 MAG: antioxidant AhpC [Ignavibacteria bacterium CG1_02_37_35]PIP76480.1 MAG: antioxidant AhpC [Ignavibacteria bacterium CG22_combo_CG10-13_8_21_14_all_37_15]PIS46012.1 MAG: antioxidant AhpC [Ignavibacteria bacterium CG08_land_8_20_14_0_20_37_9]PIX95267.1 MAG: antioxidant AhpC [Ignavibacteria bacterium CG_4_10_14_3_um_filter_37_18]PJC58915.1 MAG: antioxidant AhpC [Ignavibacteria bacterium CG_4_9_14_0_2_um_filter_37_13]